jgi:hypothetical protein
MIKYNKKKNKASSKKARATFAKGIQFTIIMYAGWVSSNPHHH